MLKLTLLRHAKSSWDNPELDDFERPLSRRGTKAARAIGAYLEKSGTHPDLVLCSSALRARATLALVLAEQSGPPPPIAYHDELYLASPATLKSVLATLDAGVRHVLVIGHNPGLHALALELTGRGDRKLVSGLATGFPTASLAELVFDVSSWDALAPGSGHLQRLVSPRDL